MHPAQIQRLLGHASIRETMDTYGHLFPQHEDVSRRALDGLFGDAGTHRGRTADGN